MTITATTRSRPEATTPELVRTARTTGLLYLGLALTGLIDYMLVRNQLFVADDPAATLANLTQHESLARLGIVMEMGVVITQAFVALWFYRLFKSVNPFAAGSIAAFGLVNAAAILGSAAMLATALEVSQDASLTVSGGAAATAQLLYVVSGNLWIIGGIFFGLWLIPMGWLARRLDAQLAGLDPDDQRLGVRRQRAPHLRAPRCRSCTRPAHHARYRR